MLLVFPAHWIKRQHHPIYTYQDWRRLARQPRTQDDGRLTMKSSHRSWKLRCSYNGGGREYRASFAVLSVAEPVSGSATDSDLTLRTGVGALALDPRGIRCPRARKASRRTSDLHQTSVNRVDSPFNKPLTPISHFTLHSCLSDHSHDSVGYECTVSQGKPGVPSHELQSFAPLGKTPI